jgi:hypothetical protein
LKGIDQHRQQTGKSLAKLGIMPFIADIYGESNYPKNNAHGSKGGLLQKTKHQGIPKNALALGSANKIWG